MKRSKKISRLRTILLMTTCMLLLMSSAAFATTYAVTITKTSVDFNFSFDTNWSDNSFESLKEFVGYCPSEPSVMLAGMVYLCFKDNTFTDKDYMYTTAASNGMATNQYGELLVVNNGTSSGWTSDYSWCSGADTGKITHSTDSVKYKVYFHYEN